MQRCVVSMLVLKKDTNYTSLFHLLQANGLGWYPEFNKVGLTFVRGGGAAEGMRVDLTQS